MKERRELTPAEKAKAAKAKALWLVKKKGDGVTQEDANASIGWSQSTFGQYINGRIPMNLEATLKIANYLGAAPSEIDADLKVEASVVRRPSNSAEIPELFKQLDREDVLRIMCRFVQTMPESWRIRLAQACLSGLGGKP